MQCHVNGFRRYCEGRAFGDKERHRCLKKRQDHHRSAPELQTSRPQAQFLSDTRLLSEAVPATDLSATIAKVADPPKVTQVCGRPRSDCQAATATVRGPSGQPILLLTKLLGAGDFPRAPE